MDITNFKQNGIVELDTPTLNLGNLQTTIIENYPVDEEIHAGTGSCKSCGCRGYKPKRMIFSDDYCANCGHSYSQHR